MNCKDYEVNDKIELLEEMKGEIFNGEYRGIPVGTKGIITRVVCQVQDKILSVQWENNRTLNVILPDDKIRLVHEKENK